MPVKDLGLGQVAGTLQQRVSNAPLARGIGVSRNPERRIVNDTTEQTMAKAAAFGLPAVGLGLLDTMGQSVGVFDDDSVVNTLNEMYGPNGIGDYYQRNRETARITGEVVGLLIPGTAAFKAVRGVRYLREAGKLGQYLKNSTAAEAILGASAQLTASEMALGRVAASSLRQSRSVYSGRTFALPAIEAEKKSYHIGRAVEAVRQTVAFEAAFRTLYNDSEFFYPADYTLSDEVKWATFGGLAATGIDHIIGRYAVRNLIKGVSRSVSEPSSFGSTLSEAVVRRNDRGVAITQFAATKTQLKEAAASAPDAVQFATNVNQDITALDNTLSRQIAEMARDPHQLLPSETWEKLTRGADGTFKLNQTRLAIEALEKNETLFLYANKISHIPDELPIDYLIKADDAVLKAEERLNTSQALLRDALVGKRTRASTVANRQRVVEKREKALNDARTAQAQAQAVRDEIHYVIENTGDFSVFRNRAPNWLDNNGYSAMNRQVERVEEIIGGREQTVSHPFIEIETPDGRVKINDFFGVETKATTPKTRSAALAAASRMIEEWHPIPGQTFVLNEKLPWFQIEATLELGRRNPEAAKLIQWDGKFHNAKDAMFHVLDEKYKEFMTLMARTEREPITKAQRAIWRKTKISPAEVMSMLNLPHYAGTQPHPLLQVFTAGRMQGARSLDEMLRNPRAIGTANHPLDLFQRAMSEAVEFDDPLQQAIAMSANLFNQRDVRPIFVAARSTPMLSRNDAVIHGMIETRRDIQLSRLAAIDGNLAPFVKSVISGLVDLDGIATAKNVSSLHEGTVSGRGIVVAQERISEQFDALKAAQLFVQNSDKQMDALIAKISSTRLIPLVGSLLKTQNRASLFDFNRIEQSYRHGWDIAGISYDGEIARFLLKPDSEINARLIQQHFGNTPNAANEAFKFMPDMSVTARKQGAVPLVVSKQAAQTADEISKLSIQTGVETNALRHALGQYTIKLRDFHLPTPELTREGTWFVRNSSGRVVASYVGGTARQNEQRAIEAVKKLSAGSGETHLAVPLEEVKRNHNAFDDAFFNVIDYSDQLAKSGTGIKGGLARTEIDTGPDTLKAAVLSLNEQYLNIGTRARAAIFEPQLNYAKQAAQIQGRDRIGERNIFDRYQSLILGQSPQARSGLIASKIYGGVETALDIILSTAYSHFGELSAKSEIGKINARALRQLIRKDSDEKSFRAYQAAAEKYSPFRDTTDWLESTHREFTPPHARELLAKISLMSSTMAIRFLDVGMAILNMSGLATTTPSIIQSLRRGGNESIEAWKARTAAYGSSIGPEEIVTFSPMRAMQTSIHAFWSGELTAPMARAAKLGLFEPEYAAMARILTDPKLGEPSRFRRFITFASRAADDSEFLSRKLAWGMGYKIGKDLHKFKDERNAFIFANNFMNETIGNYSARNKPGMFQGAIGLPLGAFQTYMFNYYRRLFGYIERKDVRSLAAAYGAQASMFGFKGVPGFEAFNSTLFENYDGSDNMATRFDRAINPVASEMLQYGALSSIPAIFGQGGIAFYTRGSTDITQAPPSIFSFSRAPPMQFLATTAEGVKRTIQNVFNKQGFSLQQQEEIIANFSTNRAIKSIMELAANAKTDRTGQLVEAGTRDAIDIAAMMLGSVPSKTRHLQDAYYQQQQVEFTQAALRAKLNDHTRAMIRGGEFDISDLQNVVEQYRRSGGNPAYFGQWLNNTIQTSLTPKAERKMKELASSGRWNEFLNMLATLQQ